MIDDCWDPEFVAAILKNVRKAGGKRRIIYSITNADPRYGHPSFVIPPLSVDEVATLLSNYGLDLSGRAAEAIHQKSGGNPLYLLYFSQAQGTDERTLTEYELDAWRELPPLARELASYLAIGNERLPLADLLFLAGRRAQVEEVTEALRAAQVFIAEFPNGYTLRHEHQRATTLAQMQVNHNKFAYYSRRVANLLNSAVIMFRHSSYLVIQAESTPQRISRSALFDAQRRGDFRAQLSILQDILETAPPPRPIPETS